MPRHPRIARSLLVMAALAAVLSGCVTVTTRDGEGQARGTATTTPVTAAPAASLPGGASDTPSSGGSPAVASPALTERPSTEASPGGPLIGYLSLDDRLPFARSVAESVRAEAGRLGYDLVACDSRLTGQGVLDCADRLGQAGIVGLVSFQAFPELADEVCDAVGDVPTVAVVYEPGRCGVTTVGIDDAASGRLAGEAMGRFARERWDCRIGTYLSLGSSAAGEAAVARMDGYREGFERSCPLPGSATFLLDGADRVATARVLVTGIADRLPEGPVIVVGLNEDVILGAMEALRAARRTDDAWYSGQGTDPSIRQVIACDEHYVASVAHRPESFGPYVLESLRMALDGGLPPARVDVPLQLVTAGDIRELYPETPSCPG